MIQERAMELVAALRSGKYKQTPGRLRKANAYCCLGVACDIVDPTAWEGFESMGGRLYSHIYGSSVSMPIKVQEYFGFHSCSGAPRDGQRIDIDGRPVSYLSLEEANDQGCSFEEIATYIEAKWEIL